MRRFRNILRYFIIVVLDIGMMLSFHSYINLILFVGLVLFPIYSIIGVYRVRNHLSMDIFVPEDTMQKGQQFLVKFVLHNPTIFPLINATIFLSVENRFYQIFGLHQLNLPVRAGKDTHADYTLVVDHCGHFVVSAQEIRIVDLLGIVELKVPVDVSKECLIFPNGTEQNQEAGILYLRGVTDAMESKEKGYDFSEISGIREYIPGDKLQNIHWKLSVKKDELMVKERVSVSSQQLNVLVELVNDDPRKLDAVLELADGITKAFVKQNLPFTVYYYSTHMGALREAFVGNAIEREQWLEMMLYDRSYSNAICVEELYMQQHPSGGTYLYIGNDQGADADDLTIVGVQQAIAVLRENAGR